MTSTTSPYSDDSGQVTLPTSAPLLQPFIWSYHACSHLIGVLPRSRQGKTLSWLQHLEDRSTLIPVCAAQCQQYHGCFDLEHDDITLAHECTPGALGPNNHAKTKKETGSILGERLSKDVRRSWSCQSIPGHIALILGNAALNLRKSKKTDNPDCNY